MFNLFTVSSLGTILHGGDGCWEKNELRVWGKGEKEGKRKKEKNGFKTHL